jgi:hypothetical protein
MPAETERARIEERVLQRVAERVAAQRLHETARAEAAVHARSLEERREQPAPIAAPIQPPAEVLAAIASLPPQLASVVSASVFQQLQQPGGAVRAIAQINEALRTAELIAHSAASNTAFEPTRGPRVVMPAGLGGLVTAVDRAHGPTMSAMPAMPMASAPLAQQVERSYRVPTLPWIAPTTPTALGASAEPTSTRMAPTSALGAASASAPQALTHVAWADRWLARFAGASPRSLEAMQLASSSSPLLQLASAAPETVFLSALFEDKADVRQAPSSVIAATSMATMATPSVPARMPTLIPAAPPPIQRFDDSAETPDDVFAQISAAATRNRKAPVAATASGVAPTVAPTTTAPVAAERPTYADHVAHAVPSAPHAGLAAQLASSPFAPALRHVLALPSAPSFDVRSLFGGGLSATYLAGLLSTSSHELAVASPMPAWAQWSPAIADGAPSVERAIPSFDAAYVAPDDVDAAVDPSTSARTVGAPSITPFPSAIPGAPVGATAAPELAPLTTLRSALLSWTADVPAGGAPMAPSAMAPTVETLATQSFATPSPARSMLQSMSMPMVGETEPSAIGGWTSPGAIADRAFGYSLAHERSTADLSFDFVPPELVLAARVYGLGPAEAAQAARLAIAGPGQLTAMANTVDRTFVNAMAIEAERRESREGRAITTAFPSKTGDVVTAPSMPVVAPSVSADAPTAQAPSAPSAAAPSTAAPSFAALAPHFENLIGSASHSAFGVERRAPRGAFLWPAATVAALGLTASSPDGDQSMSVAALELLAAQAVAEIGTYAALDDDRTEAIEGGASPVLSRAMAALEMPTIASSSSSAAAPSSAAAASSVARQTESAGGEPAESEVLGAAGNMIEGSRRARFDALYVALSQSPTGKNLSPAARAARALALAGRGDDAPVSAAERAATVWDVLPVVYATENMSTEEAVQTQAELGANTPRGIAARASLRRPGIGGVAADFVSVEGPGLSGLSSRAGEALASYVTSVAVQSVPLGGSATSTSSPSMPMAARAGSVQELVQTGRPTGRHGGGETEIPPWFEAAARKMLGERMGTESLSMAELTLVNNAPATQIAAASKTGHVSAAPLSPGGGGEEQGESKKGGEDDVDALAEEVYLKILIMMDAARSRNGEPYL